VTGEGGGGDEKTCFKNTCILLTSLTELLVFGVRK